MSYALITGGSSGIGLELAKLFAQDGINLILVARDQAKLEQARLSLSQEFPTLKIVSFALNLALPEAVLDWWQNNLDGKFEIKYLINNAGFSNKGPLLETKITDEIALIETNIKAVVTLTRLVLPQMASRNEGHILNLGSIGSFVPLPNQATYGASKAFVLSFSQALRTELRHTKIRVTTLCPGATSTGFFEAAKIKINSTVASSIMTPREVALIGYRKMTRGAGVVVPGLLNKIMGLLSKLLPSGFTSKIGERVMGIKNN
jgi:uncharacterized protein